jgi:hypothetical protein
VVAFVVDEDSMVVNDCVEAAVTDADMVPDTEADPDAPNAEKPSDAVAVAEVPH